MDIILRDKLKKSSMMIAHSKIRVYMRNESDFGVKIYTYSDLAFCIIRIIFGMYYMYARQMYTLLFLLSILLGCKIASLIYVIVADRIVSKGINTLSLHHGIISKLNTMNKRMAFLTVFLPHIIQFIICYYIVSLLCIYASSTDHRIFIWGMCLLIALINSIFAISAMDIFTNEGFTISIRNISFDTSKNYWGEGITIIFWTVLYIILALYFSYDVLSDYISNTFNIMSIMGMIIFIASSVQTVKCLNIHDICKKTFGNLIFFDYLTYMAAMNKTRQEYLKRQTPKIILLTLMVSIFIISVDCIVMSISGDLEFSLDIIASIICIGLISLTTSIFIIRRMCEAPLLTDLFEENEIAIYFSEYIDISDTYKSSLPQYIN